MSIWTTPECSAWSRDFNYDNYLALHKVVKAKGLVTSRPVSQTTYAMLCLAFHNQMEEDFGLFGSDLNKGGHEHDYRLD